MIQSITPISRTNYNYKKNNKTPLYNKNLSHDTANISFKGQSAFYKFHPFNYFCNKLLQRSLTVSRSRFLSKAPELRGKIKNVTIKTIDNKNLICWDINPKKSKKYILFLHGMSQNITHNQPLYSALNKNGYGVMALEYRGFGANKKTKVSEELISLDTDAALEYLKKKTSSKNISVIGHSAGSAIALELARKNNGLGRVILIAPINGIGRTATNLLATTKKNYIPKFVKKFITKYPSIIEPFNQVFKTDNKIANVSSPTYIIHSANDKIIPLKSAKELSKKAKNLKAFIQLPLGGHRLGDNKIETIINILKN